MEEDAGDAGSEDAKEEEEGPEEESSTDTDAPAAEEEMGADYNKKWKKAMFK